MAGTAGAAASDGQAGASPYLGLRNIGVTVADIDATIAFYSVASPFAEVKRYALPAASFGPQLLTTTAGSVQIALIRAPTGFLQLMRFSEGPPPPASPLPIEGPGYTHICFQSSSTDPALPKLMRRGLRLVSRCDEQGVDLGGYGIRYAYGRDPEGRMIEVELLDRPQRAEVGWVSHIANVVHDHPAMLEFYTRLLAAPPHRTIRQSGRPTFDAVAGVDGIALLGGWFRVGNMELEVWEYEHPRTPKPGARRRLDEIGYNAPCFEVADLSAERARLISIGVELVGPELDLGGWISQYAVDPEGNLFCAQQCTSAPLSESVSEL